MTPIQKWPAVRAALLVTAMLMWWLPMARSQQEVCPAWFNAWPEDKVAARSSPSPAEHRKPQRKPHAKGGTASPSQSLARNRRALRAPGILAGLHWSGHPSATVWGQPLGLSQSYQC
jgi:hypothetical protein